MNKQSKILLFVLGIGALILWKREAIVAKVVETIEGWKAVPNADKYLPTLNAVEQKYGIPRDLLARMAYQESRFRDDIVQGRTTSSAGAAGIMQLVPKWHPTVDPLNVPEAIDYAGEYVKTLYDRFKSWRLAVAAYNAGPGNVQKYNGIPPFPETQNYVTSVFNDVKSSSGGELS